MRFGKKLQSSIYDPWKTHYIDYPKLKKLLREDQSSQAPDQLQWTEDDEAAFVEELINNQLEKVNAFQVEKHKDLRERTSKCEANVETLVVPANGDKDEDAQKATEKSGKDAAEARRKSLQNALKDLNGITEETEQLEKFSRVNFTGFLKAAKKHDRKRGQKYRVRPLLQARLGALPFNSEDYSPLLYR
jgi:SPX domain protein involved in polyphosphate accumulation